MMRLVMAMRAAHMEAIQENPVKVTITRTEKVEQNGGFSESVQTIGPFTVRIFERSSGSQPWEISELAGEKLVNTRWGMLTDHQSEIRAGPDVNDEFEASGLGRFRVIEVYTRMLHGQVIGYQADLEKVS